MASAIFSFAPPTIRVFTSMAAKSAIGSKEEKVLFDLILGGLKKEDQFYEIDPILKKVEDKSGNEGGSVSGRGTTGGWKNSVVVPQKKKKNGRFGWLFAKN